MKITSEQWVILCSYLRLLLMGNNDVPIFMSNESIERLKNLISEIEEINKNINKAL